MRQPSRPPNRSQPNPTRAPPRTGGYVLSDDGCWSFTRAACTEDDRGYLTIEAEGDDCYFDLRRVLDQSRTGCVEDIVGVEQSFYPGQFDADTCADSGLSLPGRCLGIVGVRAAFTGCDPEKGLVYVELTVTAESEEGDDCGEFEVWLACEYDGELFQKIEEYTT